VTIGKKPAMPHGMTIAQFIVAYAVCWWLVLFMLLPSGAAPLQNPVVGHAPSAPANPRLKRKCAWASLLAIVPTLVIYFVATTAKAEEGTYHVGGGCKTLEKHVPAADVAVRDGYGAGEKQVAGANVAGAQGFAGFDTVDIPLEIPTSNYLAADAHNGDLSHSFISAGRVSVQQNGEALLNGAPLTTAQETGGCNEAN
jgi:predicted secreted protein